MGRLSTPWGYGWSGLEVHLYSVSMAHMAHLLSSTTPSGGPYEDSGQSMVVVLAFALLGLVIVLLFVMQLAAFRRRPKRREPAKDKQPDTGSTDPWSEAGRRLDTDGQEEPDTED